jgi:hypothetical protein
MSNHYTNQGQIWPNHQKEKETQPDFIGWLNVKGEEFWISAWKEKGSANPKSMTLSFSVEPKNEQVREPAKDHIEISDY